MKLSKKLVDEIQNENKIPFNEMSRRAQDYLLTNEEKVEAFSNGKWRVSGLLTNVFLREWKNEVYRINIDVEDYLISRKKTT